MSIMASRIAFANAFLSRIPKSSSTLRAGRSGTAPTLSYLQRNSRLNNNNNKYGIGISDEDIAEFASSTDFGGYDRPGVQWYPGHIAKAERQLSETLKAVDVVVEVRDARACKATAHPRVGEWCAGSPRIVVLTHLDMVPKAAAATWRKAYDTLGAERWDEAPINRQVANQAKQARDIRSRFDNDGNAKKKNKWKNSSSDAKIEIQNTNITPVEQVLFVNAKQGQGIHALHRAIFKAGAHVQERRERRGLNPRPLRVGIIGYPNVGKVRA
jgi:ribosome biogenesis GTPase A